MQIPLAQMARRATNSRRKSIILRPIVPTAAQASALANLYIKIVRIWQAGSRDLILPAYSKTMAERGFTGDSSDDVQAAINRTEQNAVSAMLQFQAVLFPSWSSAVSVWHLQKFISTIKYATNVNLGTLIGPADARVTLADALVNNTALVRNVSDDVRSKISGSVFRGLTARTPIREVAKEISETTGLARARSVRIGSDQTVKLSAALDRERQEQVGITAFQWMHSDKKHPRPIHLARNGIIFDWDDPKIAGDLPGYAPFCGCKAKGVIRMDDESATS